MEAQTNLVQRPMYVSKIVTEFQGRGHDREGRMQNRMGKESEGRIFLVLVEDGKIHARSTLARPETDTATAVSPSLLPPPLP